MSLTPEESAKLNSTLEYCSTTAEVGERLIQSFAGGGVENPDLAVLKAQLETFASNANNIDNGVLAAANGGTGRSDGLTTDVYLSGSGSSIITAKGTGQIGDPISKYAVDANTLTTSGNYNCFNCTIALHYPVTNNTFKVSVEKVGAFIEQTCYAASNPTAKFARYYNGTTWTGWIPVQYNYTSSIFIYISKDGNDNNSGLTSDSPVLTFNKAHEIAKQVSANAICFCFGAGNWDAFTLNHNDYSAGWIGIYNYTATSSSVAVADMPHFTRINCGNAYIFFRNVDIDYLQAYSSYVTFQKYNELGSIYSLQSFINATDAHIKIYNGTNSDYVFSLNHDSCVNFGAITLTFDSVTRTNFITIAESYVFMYSQMTINGTVTGKKYVNIGGTFSCNGILPTNYPATLDGTGNYTYNGIPQQGVVLTSGSQNISGSLGVNSLNVNSGNLNVNSGTLNVKNSGPQIALQHNDLVRGTDPDETKYLMLAFCGNNGTSAAYRSGAIWSEVDRYGKASISMCVYNWGGNTESWDGLILSRVKNSTVNITLTSNVATLKPSGTETTLGSASYLWKDAYVAGQVISTSDERLKSNISSIPDEVLDAWGEVQWSQYQFNNAIEKKGANARLHTGTVAQHIDSIFKAKGLDATRYGLFCHDSWDAEDWDETIIDKEAVTETVTVVDKEAVYATRTVVISPANTDEEGVEHPAETMEEQYEVSPEESHEEERVIEPEVSHVEHHHRDAGDLYSLRYEECFAMEAAYQRRRADRIEARLAAIEAKLA